MAQQKTKPDRKLEREKLFDTITKLTKDKFHTLTSSRYFTVICNGDIELGSFIGQLVYWDITNQKAEMNYKTDEQIATELGCKPRRIEKLKKKAKKLGFIKTIRKTVRGIPITHYTVEKEYILAEIEKVAASKIDKPTPKTGESNSLKQGNGIPQNGGKQFPKTGNIYTSTTSSITASTTKELTKVNTIPLESNQDNDSNSKEEAAKEKDIYDLSDLFQQEKDMLLFWNAAMKDLPAITKHKSITSHVNSSGKKKSYTSEVSLREHLSSALEKYSADQIKEAIGNYATILSDTATYYYDQIWNLAQFCNLDKIADFLDSATPLENFKRGFGQDLSEVDKLKKTFWPITTVYEKSSYSTESSYYGFPLHGSMSIEDSSSWHSDIYDTYFQRELKNNNYGYFNALERVLAGLFYRRKTLDEKGIQLLHKSYELWQEVKDSFAERKRKNA